MLKCAHLSRERKDGSMNNNNVAHINKRKPRRSKKLSGVISAFYSIVQQAPAGNLIIIQSPSFATFIETIMYKMNAAKLLLGTKRIKSNDIFSLLFTADK